MYTDVETITERIEARRKAIAKYAIYQDGKYIGVAYSKQRRGLGRWWGRTKDGYTFGPFMSLRATGEEMGRMM